jgi:hypothetical protein
LLPSLRGSGRYQFHLIRPKKKKKNTPSRKRKLSDTGNVATPPEAMKEEAEEGNKEHEDNKEHEEHEEREVPIMHNDTRTLRMLFANTSSSSSSSSSSSASFSPPARVYKYGEKVTLWLSAISADMSNMGTIIDIPTDEVNNID